VMHASARCTNPQRAEHPALSKQCILCVLSVRVLEKRSYGLDAKRLD
jgi:hypothetical protein